MSDAVPTPSQFRRRFPALDRVVHLASCSWAPRSTAMEQTLRDMLAQLDHGSAWDEFEAAADLARTLFADLIGARADQVALVPNASVGAYQVASGQVWWQRPRLVTAPTDFPGQLHVWQAQAPRGATVVHVTPSDRFPTVEDYVHAIDERTALVSLPAVTYRDGVRLPVSQIAEAAHAAGAGVFVDAYQAVGVEPIDVTQWQCDWLVAGAGKYLLGLAGLAFLYARDATNLPRMPRLTGWQAQRHPLEPVLDHRPDARRLETGTPAVAAIVAANAGLRLLGDLEPGAVRRHVGDLVDYATDQLTSQGETVTTPRQPHRHGAHLAVLDTDPPALAARLARDGINVAPRNDVVRLAMHYFTTKADVDAACAAIHRYRARHTTLPIPTPSEV